MIKSLKRGSHFHKLVLRKARKGFLNSQQRRNERRLDKLLTGLPEIDAMEIWCRLDSRKIDLKDIQFKLTFIGLSNGFNF